MQETYNCDRNNNLCIFAHIQIYTSHVVEHKTYIRIKLLHFFLYTFLIKIQFPLL